MKDLKQRGLLDDTLVIWGGEFGRTPFLQGDIDDRKQLGPRPPPLRLHPLDGRRRHQAGHHLRRVRRLRLRTSSSDPVHVHDFQATLLHLLGIDHKRLTFRFQGRDFRLTDVHGDVVPAGPRLIASAELLAVRHGCSSVGKVSARPGTARVWIAIPLAGRYNSPGHRHHHEPESQCHASR